MKFPRDGPVQGAIVVVNILTGTCGAVPPKLKRSPLSLSTMSLQVFVDVEINIRTHEGLFNDPVVP